MRKPSLLFVQFGEHIARYDTPAVQQHYQILAAKDGATAAGLIATHQPVVLVIRVYATRPADLALCHDLASLQVPILAVLDGTLPADSLARLAPDTADVLSYPVSGSDLLDRITVVVSRHAAQAPASPTQVACGVLVSDLQAQQVWRTDPTTAAREEIHLTPIEWALFTALVRRAGSLVRHDELRRLAAAGSQYGELTTDSLRVHMRSLRQKLGDMTEPARYIFLERGKGFRFAPATPLAPRTGSPPAVLPVGVPADRNPLIGRTHELQQLLQWLAEPERRLITLTGPAGAGKTRLAARVAAAANTLFSDGVFFVSLAATNDPALLPEVIARRLGLGHVEKQSSATTLSAYLQPRSILLVLDNLEHLLAAVPWIGTLLDDAPRLKILVTSQIVLRLYSEQEYVVEPLAVPAPDHDLATIAETEAVQLFVQRAEAVKPSFRLTETNANAVARICRQLDGLPLALELAAAQVASMQPKTILARLSAPLVLLAHDLVDRSPRQTTLRHALDWSFQLLDADQQRVFLALSVFVGGWSEAGAAAVCSPVTTIPGIAAALERLRQHSLIQRSDGPDDEARFGMLEVIRAYAQEQLIAHEGLQVLQQRHADHLRALAVAAQDALGGPEQLRWLQRLDLEHDNIRAALYWSLTHDPEGAAVLSGALSQYWLTRGYLAEGRRWFDSIAYHPASLTPAARGRAFNAAGVMAQWQGEHSAARALLGKALEIRQQLGAPGAIADTRMNLASTLQDLGVYDTAQQHLQAALEVYRALGDAPAVADALNNLGLLWDSRAEYRRAELLLEEALVLYEAQQDTRSIAQVLGNLGQVARNLGNLDQAMQLLQASLHLRQQVGDRVEIANALLGLGIVATMQGDAAQAQSWLRDSLELYGEVGMRQGLIECLEGIALWLSLRCDDHAATRILSAATAIRQQEGKRRNVTDTRRYDHLLAVLREGLGAETIEQLRGQSQYTTLDAIVAFARERLRAPGDLHAQELEQIVQ